MVSDSSADWTLTKKPCYKDLVILSKTQGCFLKNSSLREEHEEGDWLGSDPSEW